MLFNSFEFFIFLPIVFIIYWLILGKNLKIQNLFIVLVSYLFYGWWDFSFLYLIAFTSICSWGSGLMIEKHNVTNRSLSKIYFMALPAINESFNQKAIDGIVEFYEYCKNKEASVLLLPPVIQNASFKNLEPNIKMVDSHLARHNLNYIAPPIRYCLEDSLFYNTPYHCNYKGVKVRTSYFIEDVSKQLDIINSNN